MLYVIKIESMNYYKILKENETHRGFKYHDGLNIDPKPFNPNGSCKKGGIYFARKDILAFLYVGSWIRKVTLPEDAQIYKDPELPEKWKADKVILGPREKITLEVIKRLVKKGANIHADNNYALQWAAESGHLDVVKFFVEKGADIYAENDLALIRAAEGGHLDVVKFLVEKGADIHADNNYALQWAAKNGHLEVVTFLVNNGANIHADNDLALRWAAESGHLEVVEFLKNI
jgi:hypothetical protein